MQIRNDRERWQIKLTFILRRSHFIIMPLIRRHNVWQIQRTFFADFGLHCHIQPEMRATKNKLRNLPKQRMKENYPNLLKCKIKELNICSMEHNRWKNTILTNFTSMIVCTMCPKGNYLMFPAILKLENEAIGFPYICPCFPAMPAAQKGRERDTKEKMPRRISKADSTKEKIGAKFAAFCFWKVGKKRPSLIFKIAKHKLPLTVLLDNGYKLLFFFVSYFK